MTIFSQDDPVHVKIGKTLLFICTTVVSLVVGTVFLGLCMVVFAEGPRWFFKALVFLVLEPVSKCLQLLYSWVV